jgi:hypothetical protein
MNIYRNKENKKLYIIEHLILDIKHLNRNAFAGIYAQPYNWKGEQINLQSKNQEECRSFVEQNFEIVAYT